MKRKSYIVMICSIILLALVDLFLLLFILLPAEEEVWDSPETIAAVNLTQVSYLIGTLTAYAPTQEVMTATQVANLLRTPHSSTITPGTTPSLVLPMLGGPIIFQIRAVLNYIIVDSIEAVLDECRKVFF